MIKNKNGEYIPGVLEINLQQDIIRSIIYYICLNNFELTLPARKVGGLDFPGGSVELRKTSINSSTWNSVSDIFFLGKYLTASLTVTNCCVVRRAPSKLTKKGTLQITWNNWSFKYVGTIRNCNESISSPLTLNANVAPKPPSHSWSSLSVCPIILV